MPKKICVYTCITGDYDNLPEIECLDPDIDYFCFTNNNHLYSNTWKIIPIEDQHLNNHLLSRKIKMLGHPIITDNYEISLWMDAQIAWRKSIKDFIDKYFDNSAKFAAFKHSQRQSIHEEAIACLRFRKDDKDSVLDALSFLDQEQFPDNLGLYEMTVFIKRHNDPEVIKTMNLWFDMVKKHSKRDQLSFMYCIWKTGLKINPIHLNMWDNPWFYPQSHQPNISITDCRAYYGNPDSEFNLDKYYIYPYKHIFNLYKFTANIPNDTNEIELDVANSVGISYTNISIRPQPTKISPQATIDYNDKTIFCIDQNIIKLYGNFKKGQKLLFEADLKPINYSLLNLLLGYLYFQNEELDRKNISLIEDINHLKADITSLDKECQELSKNLAKVLNSRGWQYLEKIRKITHR